MLKAKDFRRYARESLKGRWLKAGVAAFVAGLLGASISVGSAVPGNSARNASEMMDNSLGNATETIGNSLSFSEIPAGLLAGILAVALVIMVWALVVLVIGGATTLGYAKYNLKLVDDQDPKLKDVVSQYHRLGTGFGMQFFRTLFIFLWSLLFVIPGIFASFSYSMAPYILCEHPEMTARESIRESKKLMRGNRMRLFALELSFIGWQLLAGGIIFVAVMLVMTPLLLVPNETLTESMVVTLLIVFVIILILAVVVINLTLAPYMEAAVAVFYREISEGRYSNPVIEAESFEEKPHEMNMQE